MRVIYTIVLCVFLAACSNKKNANSTMYLPASNGNLNSISVVVDNGLWDGSVGECIRQTFAAPINGLLVDEPMFKLRQIPPQVFNGFATRSRIVLKLEKGVFEPSTKITTNTYAKPQTMVVVSGKTNQDLIAQLKATKSKIIDAFNDEEITEKQRRIGLDLLDVKAVERQLAFKVNLPSVYRFATSEDRFFWLRKSLDNTKTIDLMFYEVPLETLAKGDSTVTDIITTRNYITKTKIPGEDGIYMAVEDAYAPSMFKTTIDGKPAYEVRGLWEMKGYTMGGPFITYAIEDRANNRWLIADGYVYAPSINKSDYIFELEAIIKSIKFKQ